MKTIAVIRADLNISPIGTASRLADEIGGTPVLTRTLRRVGSASKLDRIVVASPADQHERVRDLIDVENVDVVKFEGPEFPSLAVVRIARKWSLHSWRGGIGNSCFFDEHIHPSLCHAIAGQLGAQTVVCVAAEAPLIDPVLIDDMIEHYLHQRSMEDLRLVFAQAPPGLAATLLHTELLEELARTNLAPGWLNSYRPDQPRVDLIAKPTCFRPPLVVQQTHGRLTSDTRRGFELLTRLISSNGDDASSEEICIHLNELRRVEPETFPLEVQIELTTEDQHAGTILRPRGAAVEQRSPMTTELFRKVIDEVTLYDDSLVVLGGFGEPLLHPEFADFVRICREGGVYGLAVRTNGIALNEEIAQVLLDHQVDFLQVHLDANEDAAYESLHGVDAFDEVKSNIDMLNRLREARKQPAPIVVPTLIKSKETFDDLDVFFDQWLRKTGWAVIEGYSHHAGQMPDRCVMSMAPPKRVPCRQLQQRGTVLCDGTVVGCDQDFNGRYVVGRLQEHGLAEIWSGRSFGKLRNAHRAGDYALHPLCRKCDEWHRP